MKKFVSDLIVTSNQPLNNQYFLLKLTAKNSLPEMKPGQFVNILVDKSSTTYLRRPISINFVDRLRNEMWLLVQKVGDGTHALAKYKEGEILNLVYPLGNTFTEPQSASSEILLVGGGVGVAPMLMLGVSLKEKGFKPIFLLGARSKNDLLELEMFEQYGKLYTTTEDGSQGEKGFVTNHSILRETKFDKIYTCGPTPMMKAIASYAKQNDIDCEVSLENVMACGVGACLCCVEDTAEGHKCVCTDGPVFNVNELKWQI